MPADPNRPEIDHYAAFLNALAGLIDDAELAGYDQDGLACLHEAGDYFRSDYRILHPEQADTQREGAMLYAGLCAVMEEARRLVCRPGNDFSWAGWAGEADALREIDGLIAQLKADKLPDPLQLRVLFAPTGPLQELSISSGWGREFLALSERFDGEYERAVG